MYFGKRLGLAVIAGAMCFSLAACAGDSGNANTGSSASQSSSKSAEKLMEFSSPNNAYSINIPDVKGGWTQTKGTNDYLLVLDNPDQSFSILIQAYPKENAVARWGSVEKFADEYRKTNMSKLGEPTEDEVDIPIAENIIAESYSVKQSGISAKAVVAYFETENYYYNYAITGLEKEYDKNIDAQKKAMSSLTEN